MTTYEERIGTVPADPDKAANYPELLALWDRQRQRADPSPAEARRVGPARSDSALGCRAGLLSRRDQARRRHGRARKNEPSDRHPVGPARHGKLKREIAF